MVPFVSVAFQRDETTRLRAPRLEIKPTLERIISIKYLMIALGRLYES